MTTSKHTLMAAFLIAASAHAIPPHDLTGGLATFEAEDFSNNIPRGVRAWELKSDIPGYSGAGFMVCTNSTADANSNINVNVETTSPELQYGINFSSAAPHFIWARASVQNTQEDSVHVGINGSLALASPMTFSVFSNWSWCGIYVSVDVTNAGTGTLSFWMREDGARIDRIAVSTNASFRPRIGNAWHIPDNVEPSVGFMRSPILQIYSNTTVTIYNGNQFQGGTNAGNQVSAGSTIYYKHATSSVWIATAMTFQATSGNNKYYAGSIPPNAFQAGDIVQYYLRIPYDNFLPTFLATSNGVSFEVEDETEAMANPFSYEVLATPAQGSASPADWRNENIYFLMTDRFFDGDPSNNSADPFSGYEPANGARLHGGDLQGVEKKLDYIKALGATAIWITPIPHNTSNRAYHGYSAYNFYALAPQLGSSNDLVSFTSAAHDRGIKVVLDIVANHAGRIINSANAGFPAYNPGGYNLQWAGDIQYPEPFTQTGFFHNFGDIGTYSDPEQILGDLRGLDDLKTETLAVRSNLVDIYSYWIEQADLDGFRIDTVKHVDMGFWQHFGGEIRAAARQMGKTNFFQFGEVFDQSDAKCGSYTGTKAGGPFAMESVVDYPLYYKLNSVFATASGNTKQIEDRYTALAGNYDSTAQDRLVTFLDNHDNDRFLSGGLANNNVGRLQNALTFLYTSRGIPCLYYGTEQHFNGGGDPNNREDMFDGLYEQGPSLGDNFDMTKSSFLHVAKLNNFRRLYPSLRTGTHINRWNTPGGPGIFAYARRTTNEEVLVVLNTAASTQTLTNRSSFYAPGTVMVNLFNTNETITVTAATSTPPIQVSATSYKMFIASSLWKPLDPVVTSQVPAHAASGIAPSNAVTLRFSKPMDTNAVQASFSVTPSVSGTFGWNAQRTEMTFTPGGFGFANLSTNVIKLATNAFDSVSTNAFFAPFETFFVTASSGLTDNVPPTVSIGTPASGSTITGPLTITGTATDNAAVQTVELRFDGGSWHPANGTTSWSFAVDSANFLNGTHVLSARASDTSSLKSTNASVSVRFFNVPGDYTVRISPGSPSDVTNCDSHVWVGDRPYAFGAFGHTGGNAGQSANTISGICAEAQALYRDERYAQSSNSGFGYLFDCPEGLYEITLLEAETTFGAPNQRTFDLRIEGQQVLSLFDIFAEAGAMNSPVSLVFTSAVSDAQLAMDFLSQVNNARASGIQVRRIGEVDSDGDGTPNWWMLGHFDHATGQDADQTQATDDADGDGLNNYGEYVAGSDPTNSASFLHIESIALQTGVQVAWPSTSNRFYAVEALPSPDNTNGWLTLQQNLPGTGGNLSLLDTNSAGQGTYRVRVRLP